MLTKTKSMIPIRRGRVVTTDPTLTVTMSGREDPILTGIAMTDPITTEKAVAVTGPVKITTGKVEEDTTAKAAAVVMTAAAAVVVTIAAVAAVVTIVAAAVVVTIAAVAAVVTIAAVAAVVTTAAVAAVVTIAAVAAVVTIAAVAAVVTTAAVAAVVTRAAAAREGQVVVTRVVASADLSLPDLITKYTLLPCCLLQK
jgi:hypothetical protein